MSVFDEFIQFLEENNVRVTFDPDRDCTKPCIGCGRCGPNDLVHVGQYVFVSPIGTAVAPRDWCTRPMCKACQLAFVNDAGEPLRTAAEP